MLWSVLSGTVGYSVELSVLRSVLSGIAVVLWSVLSRTAVVLWSVLSWIAVVLWYVLSWTVGCSAVVSPVWDIWL